jgi:hypothetical protein
MADSIDIVQDESGAFSGLTDEEISTLSEQELESRVAELEAEAKAAKEAAEGDGSPDPGIDPEGDQSGAEGEEEGAGIVEAGGAADDFQSLDPHADVPGTTSVDQSEADGDGEGTDDEPVQGSEDDQSEPAAGGSDPEPDPTDKTDWKAKYKGLLAPFKASGRMVQIESPEDAIRLMQMGYDYTDKMRAMKPHIKVLKTLEANDLLEPEKINFAIDLLKGNPEAVKKFLKDKSIDPIDLDLEDSTEYSPTDHSVSDEQIALDGVLDSIRDTKQFPRTAQIITKEWDTDSQTVLMGTPALIATINDHMGKGYFDQIAAQVQYDRSMGRLQGLSDLDAYKTVGDAMHKAGKFKPSDSGDTTQAGQGAQGHSQDPEKGSGGRKARKRAASPTKGKASAGNAQSKNFLSDFTDEEMESM